MMCCTITGVDTITETINVLVSPATPLSSRRKDSGINHDAKVSGAQECCALFNVTEYTI